MKLKIPRIPDGNLDEDSVMTYNYNPCSQASASPMLASVRLINKRPNDPASWALNRANFGHDRRELEILFQSLEWRILPWQMVESGYVFTNSVHYKADTEGWQHPVWRL